MIKRKIKIKTIFSIAFAIVLICFITFNINNNVLAIDGITVSKDLESNYVPTAIINGDFQTPPWMKYTYDGKTYETYASSRNDMINTSPELFNYYKELYYKNDSTYNYEKMYNRPEDSNQNKIVINGTNKGWNTSEITLLNGSIFEWVDGYGHNFDSVKGNLEIDWNRNYGNGVDNHSADTVWLYGNNTLKRGNYFVEMNANNAAVLYQDLTTYSGDVIRWSLKHAVRTEYGFNNQTIEVEIGAPKYNNGKIAYPLGINNDINTNIQSSTSAKYFANGTIQGNNGYSSNEKLKYLKLDKLNSNENDDWFSAEGVYIIPENQNTTRFAFVSASVDSATDPNGEISGGNLLDDITFNTLIGNLHAVQNDDGTLTITGYWGETDPTKSLVIKIGDEDYNIKPENGNFKIEIDKEKTKNATAVEVYHQDYEDAKKIVNIEHVYDITFDSNGGSSVSAQKVLNGRNATKPTDPKREGYTFTGWYKDLVSETKFSFTEGVTASQTIYAKWTANQYNLTFDVNGGDSLDSSENTKTVTYDEKYGDLPIPTREGYTFQGWFTDDTFTNEITETSDVKITSDTELIAKWLVIPGKVSIVVSDESEINTTIINSDDNIVEIVPLDQEDEEKLENGKDLYVFAEVTDISKVIPSSDKKLVKDELKDNEEVGTYLDISIFKQFEDEEKQLIEQTDSAVTINMEIPKALQNKDGYKILKITDGEVEEVESTLKGTTLIFDINNSSTYVLVYTKDINPNTLDSVYTHIGLLILSILGVIDVILYSTRLLRKQN